MGDYWIEGTQCSIEDLVSAEPGSPCAPDNGEVTEPSFPALPIPQQRDAKPVREFIGAPATPKPVTAGAVPEHPFMAPNGLDRLFYNVGKLLFDRFGELVVSLGCSRIAALDSKLQSAFSLHTVQ